MSDDPGTPEDRRRQRKLGRARADLVALPDLVTELALCLTERTGEPGGGKPGKVIGSPAPLRLDVLHLVDPRRKPGWEGDDPRINQIWERYGVVASLESWVRIVSEEMPDPPDLTETATVSSECSVLIEVWDWIEDQQWADELADDVSKLARSVRLALGEQIREPRYFCIECGARAYLRFGDGFMVCDEGHEHSVRNLEEQQRRRPAMPTDDIVAEFGITRDRLYSWHKRRQIRPAPGSVGKLMWFPWDVLMLLNPDMAHGFETGDTYGPTGA